VWSLKHCQPTCSMCLQPCIDIKPVCTHVADACSARFIMTGKEARGSSDEQQAPHSLASLPDSALSHIAQLYLNRYASGVFRPPLLAVSRACRDSVLSNVMTATLGVQAHPRWTEVPIQAAVPAKAKVPAWARLLNRTCSLAPPGLNLTLKLSHMSDVLPKLLQPGVNCGGWTKVHSLQVGTHLCRMSH
jgi:hypothetical protein